MGLFVWDHNARNGNLMQRQDTEGQNIYVRHVAKTTWHQPTKRLYLVSGIYHASSSFLDCSVIWEGYQEDF